MNIHYRVVESGVKPEGIKVDGKTVQIWKRLAWESRLTNEKNETHQKHCGV